jgi:twitching motility protein PilI
MQTSASLSRIQELLPQLFQKEVRPGESYLKFALTDEIAAVLTIVQVQETMVIPADQLTPVPNLPEWVVGLMNAQNKVFMVIDLPQVMGLPMTTPRAQQYHIIVVRAILNQQEFPLGLVVNRIQGLVQVMDDEILPAGGAFPQQFIPYLGGYLPREGQKLMVLNAEVILQQLNRHLTQS